MPGDTLLHPSQGRTHQEFQAELEETSAGNPAVEAGTLKVSKNDWLRIYNECNFIGIYLLYIIYIIVCCILVTHSEQMM